MELKETHNVVPNLKWAIVKHAKSYSINARSCSLCLQEKYETLNYPVKSNLLNKRSELISKCRHANKYLLAYYKTND